MQRRGALLSALTVLLAFAYACGTDEASAPSPPAERAKASGSEPPTVDASDTAQTVAKSRPVPAGDLPNVIVFIIDTLRADRVGLVGDNGFRTTPNLDALADEAVVFEQATAPAPWTLPSIVSMFTSTLPCEHGSLTNKTPRSAKLIPLARRMQRAGYTTFGTVWNAFVGEKYGMDYGYEWFQHHLGNDGEAVAELFESRVRTPYFLYVHNIEPHNPYHFAPAHIDGLPDISAPVRKQIEGYYKQARQASRADWSKGDPPGTAGASGRQQAAMDGLTLRQQEYSTLYDGAVRLSDDMLGSVIDLIRERGEWDNTLLIFTSDHGEEMNDHGGWIHDQSAYQELMHVPLLIKFPHSEFAGLRVKAPVSLIDVMPTLSEFLQRPGVGNKARGMSLMPLIRGEVDENDLPPRVVGIRVNKMKYFKPWADSRGDLNIVIREAMWKGIWNVDLGTFELYDLATDPREHNDVSGGHADRVARFRDAAQAHARTCQAGEMADETIDFEQLDTETLERMRELGYVGGSEDNEP